LIWGSRCKQASNMKTGNIQQSILPKMLRIVFIFLQRYSDQLCRARMSSNCFITWLIFPLHSAVPKASWRVR